MLLYFDQNDMIRLRPARQYLETLLPMLPAPILEVGLKPYNKHYRDLCSSDKYVSVDIVGERGPDLVADVLLPCFPSKATQLYENYGSVLFNGVMGFGVDTEQQMRLAFENFYAILRSGGVLLVGWNKRVIGREALAVLLKSVGFIESKPSFQPDHNPERHCFWEWKK